MNEKKLVVFFFHENKKKYVTEGSFGFDFYAAIP